MNFQNLLFRSVWLIPLCIYLLALNPYMTPDTYDNVVYYEGARSLAASGEYKIGNTYIIGWPPGVSILLTIPLLLGFQSVVAAKGIMIFLGVLSLILFSKFMKNENRPFSNLSCFLFALAPYTLQAFSRILSEAPFLFLSTLFLFILSTRISHKILSDLPAMGREHCPRDKARPMGGKDGVTDCSDSPRVCEKSGLMRNQKPSLFLALLSGFIVSFAILIRMIGVLLIVPLLVDLIFYRGRERKKSILCTLIPILFACITFFIWKLYIWRQIVQDELVGQFYVSLDRFSHFNIFHSVNLIADTMFHIHLVQGFVSQLWFSIPILCFIVFGLFSLYREGRLNSIDAYVAAMVLTISFYEWKLGRYFIYVLPFLYSYFFYGISCLFSFSKSFGKSVIASIGAFSVFLLIALDAALLIFGNGKTYSGISPFFSSTAESFYIGYWNDLYRASTFIKDEGGIGNIAATGKIWEKNKYIYFFSGEKEVVPQKNKSTRFIITEKDPDFEQPKSYQKAAEFGSIRVFIINSI